MAKKRLPPVRRPAAPRRTVAPVPPDQVQPGAVAMTLSSAHTQPGVTTAEDDEAESQQGDEHQAEKVRTFLAMARRRFRMSADAESELRRHMQEDMRFYNSNQWPDTIKGNRELDDRVCLTINRLPQFVRQVVNQARSSRPAIQVNPVDNQADPDTAEVYQGIIRQIETLSKAQIAYGTASEHQAIMGRGWWRLIAEYARDDSMEQEIRIKRILDQFTVYPDPSCEQPDNSDATFCFIVTRLTKDAYNAKYRTKATDTPVSASEFQSIGDDQPIWLSEYGVQVAEYFYLEYVPAEIADVIFNPSDGQSPRRVRMDPTAIRADLLKPQPGETQPRVVILKRRHTVRKQVKWALINGTEIIDGNKDRTAGRDLPGSYIPVIPVIGEELIVDGRRNLRGMVRDAQSPQRAYNFWLSAITERLALSTKAPIVAAVGQLEGLEDKWNSANQRNYAYLEYNPVDLNGQLVPPPNRTAYDPDIGAALQMTMQADRDLKSVVGMFDASQEQSREQSGKAILARQRQGEEGTSHFLDNLARSIEHTGRILVEWIPIYYDAPRMLRINGLDEQARDVVVHAGQASAADDLMNGMDDKLRQNIMSGRPFDLGVGRYDVTISVGRSYPSRRQEAVDSLVALVQANPALMPVIGDILMENMDWPGARQLAARLKRMVPPEARDPEAGQEQIPPQAQAQIQQMQQQLQMLTAELQKAHGIIDTKAQELAAKGQISMAEIQSKERVEAMKTHADMVRSQAELNSEKAIALLKEHMAHIRTLVEHAHETGINAMPPMEPMGPPPGKKLVESLNYKDAPPDIQRQIERQAGLSPSRLPPEPKAAARPGPKRGSGQAAGA